MKTHLLRVRPPWRLIPDQTRCGRLLSERMTAVTPSAEQAAKARADWLSRYQKITGHSGRFQGWSVVRQPPAGTCAFCWYNLGAWGQQDWREDPLAVLAVDLAVKNGTRRRDLAREFLGLAALAAAHPGELADLIAAEDVLTALRQS